MGNAVIWYYPEGDTVEEIDVSAPFGGLTVLDVDHDASQSESVSGVDRVIVRQNRLRVTLHLDRITNLNLINRLYSLETHLRRRGVIAICNDVSKAWCGPLTAPPKRGDTVFRTSGNPYGSLSGSTQQVAAGDPVVIASLSPEAKRHHGTVDSAGYGAHDRITLTGAMIYSPRLQAWARYRDFYPALVMEDVTAPMIQTVMNGRGITVEVDLVEHLPTIAALTKLPADYYTRSNHGGAF